MNWIMSLMLLWGTFTAAVDQQAAVEAEQARIDAEEAASMAKAEADRFNHNLLKDEILASDYALIPDRVYQGDAFMVRSKNKAEISWQGKTYPLQKFMNGYYALLPVSIGAKPGVYTVGAEKLTVLKADFKIQRLHVTKEQEAMKQNVQRIEADQKKINAARSHSAATFLFTDSFIKPVDGAVLTTPYGFTRYVNGKFDGSHRAVDLAVPEGTPVRATNAGKVVLADYLYLTGNSVYIDHGMNLFSQYAHMSKLLVSAGDEVKAGQIIGLVGTTGFSTGPHMHFTFWIGNDPVNPNLFFDSSPFLWHTKNTEQ